jgi:hypothetical protein
VVAASALVLAALAYKHSIGIEPAKSWNEIRNAYLDNDAHQPLHAFLVAGTKFLEVALSETLRESHFVCQIPRVLNTKDPIAILQQFYRIYNGRLPPDEVGKQLVNISFVKSRLHAVTKSTHSRLSAR